MTVTINKSIKFVPGLAAVHRTPLSGRRLFLRYMPELTMKIFAKFILLFFSVGAFAECPEQQDLDIQATVNVGDVEAGGSHGEMDVVTISMPHLIKGVPFQSIQLTYGEVSEYWLPLATDREGGRVVATLSGYRDSIKAFEFMVNYSDAECALYHAGSVASAYNNQMQPTPKNGAAD